MALPQSQPEPTRPRRIAIRAVLLGAATAAGLNIYSDYTGMILGSASLVKSQLSMAMLLPFVAWLAINLALKLAWPRMALSQCRAFGYLQHVVDRGHGLASGWTTYWGGVVSTPFYYASPKTDGKKSSLIFCPWVVFAPSDARKLSARTTRAFRWRGHPLARVLASLHWWFAVSIALVVAGLCLAVIFQKQWEENERLTFPLAAFPIALTEGFDEPGPRHSRHFLQQALLGGFLCGFRGFCLEHSSGISPSACRALAFTTVI